MATLVFDIETAALPPDHFDEAQQEYLFRDAERQPDEAAKTARRAQLEQMMSLWPFTPEVLCIPMGNAETQRGKVLFLADDPDDGGTHEEVDFTPCADEPELLAAFWNAASHYDHIVTFNGRGFDVPFLYLEHH